MRLVAGTSCILCADLKAISLTLRWIFFLDCANVLLREETWDQELADEIWLTNSEIHAKDVFSKNVRDMKCNLTWFHLCVNPQRLRKLCPMCIWCRKPGNDTLLKYQLGLWCTLAMKQLMYNFVERIFSCKIVSVMTNKHMRNQLYSVTIHFNLAWSPVKINKRQLLPIVCEHFHGLLFYPSGPTFLSMAHNFPMPLPMGLWAM